MLKLNLQCPILIQADNRQSHLLILNQWLNPKSQFQCNQIFLQLTKKESMMTQLL